ncbi:MAG TPA: tetratricopeptide repeat protein, partial [Pyrinomonadaceae bacterium]|nr:tetratricopeptide repeat protein [Pyrinomonadaceae bacterium]
AEFADLIVAADIKLNLNDRTTAEQYLTQATQTLSQNPTMHIYLQGHFNKVYGKFYMHQNPVIALQYFDASNTQFSGNPLEQAEVKMFIGIAHYYADSLATAKIYFEEAKTAFDSHGDLQKSAQALNNIGVVYFRQGDVTNAQLFCQNSLDINSQIGQKLNARRNQQNLAIITGSGGVSSSNNPPEDGNEGAAGGTGTGTGSTITTSGSGTVVVTTPGG